MAKPTIAFALSLIAGIIYSITGVLIAIASALYGGFGLACGIVMIVGSMMMNGENRSRIRIGAIMVLIFTIIGQFFNILDFIGFILGVIGSVLGLMWKPPAAMQTPAPPSSTV